MDADSTIGATVSRMRASVLTAVRLDLDRLILPDLRSPEARMAAQLASEMLAFLAVGARMDGLPGARNTLRLRALLERATALLVRGNVPTRNLVRGSAEDGTEGKASLPASELCANEEHSVVASELASVVAALLALPRGRVDAEALRSLLQDCLAAERDEQVDLYARVRTEMEQTADPVAAVETGLTPERLDEYFAKFPPETGPGPVVSLERIPGGYSKDTFRLATGRGLAGHRELILRRDLPFGPGENSVVDEYDLLNRLADAGLLVPRPLWREADPAVAGRPFLLFARLPGSAVFGDWHAPAAERERVCVQVAQLMARLHELDPYELGVAARAPDATPQSTVQAYVRHWREKWQRRRSHPSLILETAFDWLERHAPTSLERVSLVHGDISFRNTLIDAGQLTALLDWEFWHLGDPVEDLSYFRLVAEPYVDWRIVMDAYQAAGGGEYSAERAAFYEVWRSVRNSTTTATAWHGFLSGAYPASKAAYQGVSLYRLFLRDVADKLQRVEL